MDRLELLENKTILENKIIALCDNLRDGCLIIEQSKQYIIQLNDLYIILNNINIKLEA